jgi:16S rRNA (guanine1516-N2)-methyltransferase
LPGELVVLILLCERKQWIKMTAHPSQPDITFTLAISCDPQDDPLLQAKSHTLKKILDVGEGHASNSPYSFLLVYTREGLELRTSSLESTHFATKPLHIDFISGNTGYRLQHGGGIHQPLARAVGLKPGIRPSIVDATAGLGVDGFILASLGCEVTMIERSPVMGALLADGLQRAASHPATREIAERIQLCLGNAWDIIRSLEKRPATIYLDPMYPHRRGTALNKQEMRTIRELVGDDQDAAALLETALDIASNRVVVKRPKGAPRLNTRCPSHIIEMKNSRFDVYLTGLSR